MTPTGLHCRILRAPGVACLRRLSVEVARHLSESADVAAVVDGRTQKGVYDSQRSGCGFWN
jgi:hypothetical protein